MSCSSLQHQNFKKVKLKILTKTQHTTSVNRQ